MSIRVPEGYLVAGVHARIKRDPQKPDFTLIMSEQDATGVGVYTQNLVVGAPVVLNRERTPSDRIRCVAINSGIANACTGERGLEDARQMARLAATACAAEEDQALVLSTGLIGEFLPMDKIEQGVMSAAVKLGRNEASLTTAARGMMTTDLLHKIAGRTVALEDREVQITGIAKGAGMVGPNMATMLAVIMTDAALEPGVAQAALTAAANESFNCVSVDGHTSTSDTVLLLANGAAGGKPLQAGNDDLARFQAALEELCIELAKAVAADGEGASHLITLEVTGCASRASALQIARTIANSPLVKTAVAGNDPNWGRIVSAAGYAGVPFKPECLCLRINGTLLYEGGAPVEFDADAVSNAMRNSHDTLVELSLDEGDARARFWTCDFTAEYVRINADYHT
jgi:glutamate N-acetyltransferase/amino-acid N-acetyltransferase